MSRACPWLLAVLLIVGCSSAEVSAVTVAEEPVEEVAPLVRDTPQREPTTHVCVGLWEAALGVAETGELTLPEPYRLVIAEEPDERLHELHGFHPAGVVVGNEVTLWPEVHGSESELVFTLLHEMGHLFDARCLGRDREAWMDLRSLEEPWVGETYETSPHEDFADAFAVCLGGDPVYMTIAGEPPAPEACQLIQGRVEARR